MADLVMPILGADMEAGTLVAWRCRPGDRVRRGDIVAEVETDKGLIEIEAYTDGVVERHLVSAGTKVPVGTPLAVIREEAATPGASAPGPSPAATAAPPAAPTTPSPAATRTRVSPAARRRAAELGVTVDTVAGTGADGAVTVADVERAAGSGASPTAPGPTAEPSGIRRAIAAAMSRSKREIPHFYLASTIDLRPATAWLAATNRERPLPERLLMGILFVKAVAMALREVPELNALWQDGRAVRQDAVHVGVAIALRGGGLVAPALLDADRRPLGELMAAFRDLVGRVRAGRLKSSELGLPTITVTSLGEKGVEAVFPVIYPPQVAIVGFGTVVERPWADAGRVVTAPVVTVTLAADHRVTDGHQSAAFLSAVGRRLGAPETL